VIATGSKPCNPLNVPFDNQVILDSNRLLNIDHDPQTLIVLGGGIIGVDKRARMLPLLDAEIWAPSPKSSHGDRLENGGNERTRFDRA